MGSAEWPPGMSLPVVSFACPELVEVVELSNAHRIRPAGPPFVNVLSGPLSATIIYGKRAE